MWIAGRVLCFAGIAPLLAGGLGRQARLPRSMWVSLLTTSILRRMNHRARRI